MSGPRWPVVLAGLLALALCIQLIVAATRMPQPATAIHPCALVETRDGSYCR